MNYSTAVFLINNDVRCVSAIYDEGKTPTLFKTLDPDLKKDDYAVVPTDTRFGFTIVKIVETDVDVDFDSQTQMRWIAGVFDRKAFDRIIELENKAIAAVRSAETRRKRDELREAMFKDHAETLKTLGLSSATIESVAEIPDADVTPPPA